MKPGPGKFEGCHDKRIARVLYDIAGMSGCDEDIGSVQELGWFGLIIQRNHAYIISEDSQGFFDYTYFDSVQDAREAYNRIVSEYDELDANADID
jgi:hypothetical protein